MDISPERKSIFEHLMSGIGKRVQPRPDAEPAKILTLHKTPNPHTNEYSFPQKKGFLKRAFAPVAALGAGFALTAAFKLAVSTSIRATDVSMGLGSAVTGGITALAVEAIKDYRDVKKKDSSLRLGQISKQIIAQHYKKYGIKTAMGFGAGFAGAWGADLLFDNFDIGEKLKEQTQPWKNFTAGLSERWAAFKNDFSLSKSKISAWISERWADIKNAFPPKSVSWQKITPSASAPLPMPSPSAIPELSPAGIEPELSSSGSNTIAERTSEPAEIAVTELTPRQQLAELLDKSRPGSDMDKAVYHALQGKPSAMNRVVDGLYNERGGFTKDRKLAATLIQEFTAPLEGKPLAELSRAQQDLLLKLAYMQFNPEHAKLGVEFNPLHSLEIVEKLGRSWPGAPELAPSIPIAEPEEIAKAAEKISCTITQSPPDIQPQFKVHCLPNPEILKPGDSVNLGFDWNNGIHQDKIMVIGPKAATMPPRDYFKVAMFEILRNAKQPVASAQPLPEI
ncbi:MAG: hypothetical protein DYH13_05560 [Alphaproteobacteria bacterium PRO2]|nr:hypothetical protein [Alphaproteobacteria bacterium PRO2]